jgi:hypothetical protein
MPPRRHFHERDFADRANGGFRNGMRRQKPYQIRVVVVQLGSLEIRMAQACYSIEKTMCGWIIRVDGEAVMLCKEKKMALNIARHAGRLMGPHGDIAEYAITPSVTIERSVRHTLVVGEAWCGTVQ